MENNNKKIFVYMLIVLTVVFVSTYVGYLFIADDEEGGFDQREMVLNNISTTNTDLETETVVDVKITENTDIQYNYKEDGVIVDTVTKKATPSLIGMTKMDVVNALQDVVVVEFSEDLVVLEKELIQNKSSYIVGNNNGYVSIFYRDSNDKISLLNQTQILIDPLPEQDKKMLDEGIGAKDNAELTKIIEDYTS